MTDQSDLFEDAAPSRYVVGIDLGTTNIAMAYVDTAKRKPRRIKIFKLPQLVAPGQIESLETLPSFHYQPAEREIAGDVLRMPWDVADPKFVVGRMARHYGVTNPGRLIASAKSWLCHTGVDRTAELLPWHATPDVERLSPTEASARYLRHVRDAWDAAFPDEPLADQDIVLTLPASFDEVARELTVQSAKKAGLPRVMLIEEPQAAFYAWLDVHKKDWQELVATDQRILICDIGGGTSDFTLIHLREHQDTDRRSTSGRHTVQFHRVAVGQHLILGGDNLDLALAKHLEAKLMPQGQLAARQWDVLVRSCQNVKEKLLSTEAPAEMTVHLPGTGAQLVGGGLQVNITRKEAVRLLVEGFFPEVDMEDEPQTRQSGFQEFGLPYAPDSAITKYLAAFLKTHCRTEDGGQLCETSAVRRPDFVLFNGGVFHSEAIRDRVLNALGSWFASPRSGRRRKPKVLENERLDLAVAHGAAYYGMVCRGEGVVVSAGLARSYYIGVESSDGGHGSAVCLMNGNAAPGDEIQLEQKFELLVSQPVEFPLYVSSTRLGDDPGEVVTVDTEQLTLLAPIRTALKRQRGRRAASLPVRLHAQLTEIGTLDLWCSAMHGDGRWRLQFDVRGAIQTDHLAETNLGQNEGTWDESLADPWEVLVRETFSASGRGKPASLPKRLSDAVQAGRERWPMSLLRRLWELLMECDRGRQKSPSHEARWLNLLGYSLRPGYGLAMDDWRVAETWRLVRNKLAYGTADCVNQSWILWRRICGGLPANQQRGLAEPLLASVRVLHGRMTGGKTRGEVLFDPQNSAEIWRLLGSLELMPVSVKVRLGNLLIDLIPKRRLRSARAAMIWALGRLGQRIPVYGPLNTVVPVEVVGGWLESLMICSEGDPMDSLAIMQMARRSGDRYRDLPEDLCCQIVDWMEQQAGAPRHYQKLIQEVAELDMEDQARVFGELLPPGLRIQ